MAETPLTITSLVDAVIDSVQGYSRHQDQRTSLTTGIDSDDLTLVVSDISAISKGMLEIEDEIVQVSMVDSSTNTVTLEPWGRAQSGTTAASHSAGCRVTSSPLFPRQRVRDAIYGVLREIFPAVYALASVLDTASPVETHYELPADCYQVLTVENLMIGPTNEWVPVKRWRENKQPTTVELEVLSPLAVGSNRLRINYIKIPPASFGDSDDLTAYGYDYQVKDLIVLGATARLVVNLEPARAQVDSAVAMSRAEAVPAGAAVAAAKMLYSLFRQRVEDERQQMLVRHPMQAHFLR